MTPKEFLKKKKKKKTPHYVNNTPVAEKRRIKFPFAARENCTRKKTISEDTSHQLQIVCLDSGYTSQQ